MSALEPIRENALDPETPVVILCGGRGTRLQEETGSIPKPMVTIGGYPMLWHIMMYFSAFGLRKFILCLGYKGEIIKQFALNLRNISRSFLVNTSSGVTDTLSDGSLPNWDIACVDTGLTAMTGARINRIKDLVGDSQFILTYGDGLSNVDLHALMEHHNQHGKAVTVTGVHPPQRFGLLDLNGDQVQHFSEKSPSARDYINGGFFVCNQQVFNYLTDDDTCMFESSPLERLAEDGELMAFRHDDFWYCMDTMRDKEVLEETWARKAPWRVW